MHTLRTFSPLAHLKLRTTAHILDRGHLLMAEEKLLRDPSTGCCVTFKGRIQFVPRILCFNPASPLPSSADALCGSSFVIFCHSRWKLPSHGNPAGGKYLMSNIFHRHHNRINGSWNDLEPKISRETAWSKNNSAQVAETLTLGWWLEKSLHFSVLWFPHLYMESKTLFPRIIARKKSDEACLWVFCELKQHLI